MCIRDRGITISNMVTLPPRFVTLTISANAFGKSAKFRTPNPIVAPAKLSSENGKECASPTATTNSFSTHNLADFSTATSNIFGEKSRPTTVSMFGYLSKLKAKSPVPEAISKTSPEISDAVNFAALFLQT